jgi:hypothetical protein
MAEHTQIGCATLNAASVALESFAQLWGWRKRSLHHNLRKLERLLAYPGMVSGSRDYTSPW